jgi:hypothetical protein
VPPSEPIPLSRLPHGEAARLLTDASGDPVAGFVHGRREAARLAIAAPEESSGVLPDCLLIELMAQTAGLGLSEGDRAVVASIPRLRLHRPARNGETIDVEARRGRRFGALFSFDCRATSGGALLAEGEIILRAM